jgi:predicted membrane protein
MVKKSIDKRLIVGIIIILVGATILVSNFTPFTYEIRRYFLRWEMLLIGIGLITLFINENKGFSLILIVVGGIFYFKDIIDTNTQIDFWKLFWASMLIVLGLVIMFHHKTHRRMHMYSKSSVDVLDEVAVFGGSEKMIHSENFQGGKITSIFGGQKLIFTRAKLASGQNVLELFAVFGGFELVIPEDWNVKVKIMPIFGGFVDKRIASPQSSQQSDKELMIIGTVIFGGGEIKSF